MPYEPYLQYQNQQQLQGGQMQGNLNQQGNNAQQQGVPNLPAQNAPMQGAGMNPLWSIPLKYHFLFSMIPQQEWVWFKKLPTAYLDILVSMQIPSFMQFLAMNRNDRLKYLMRVRQANVQQAQFKKNLNQRLMSPDHARTAAENARYDAYQRTSEGAAGGLPGGVQEHMDFDDPELFGMEMTPGASGPPRGGQNLNRTPAQIQAQPTKESVGRFRSFFRKLRGKK